MDPLTKLRLEVAQLTRTVSQLQVTQTNSLQTINTALTKLNAKTQRTSVNLTNVAVGSTDVAVAWNPLWPDAAYGVYASIISGAAVIGTLFAQLKNGTKTEAGCTVTVVNTGLAVVSSAALDVLGART